MKKSSEIARVNDHNLGDLLRSEHAMLILSRRDCNPCMAFQEALDALLDQGQLHEISIGKMVLNEPGSARFKRANPWLADLRVLPYVILYRRGREQNRFVPSSAAHLMRQLEETFTGA
jgi:hypothetical protein